MEYKYLWIDNICFSLQLDSVIVDQGPTGRVSIQRALSKQYHYQELMTSNNKKTINACTKELLTSHSFNSPMDTHLTCLAACSP
ncbi:hypothetical protein DSO57_1018765 [Entomophthora muscae]|uniref:Uncharacterized protein n=1 Tax=Entomophthora muscae TaxID=34485 RepID=A0ACC2TRP8_9FUNG|nr:hypothetical protein DSO57_1018765 [Entomophthora muscae]